MAREANPGQVVGGKYRLTSSLGSGGFGRVWKARDEHLQVDVAIKELWLPPAQTAAEHTERVVRAAREARNAAKLRDHPNIVTVYEVVTEDDRPWIVMQLVDGCSLEQYLDQHGPLPADRAVRLARALLAALSAAHRTGIVHRDVKPANVMITSDWSVLLTDFGIARHEQDTVMTATGLFIGSPEYAAPERIRGQDGLPASDLFSLGVTLFQAIEGLSPFRRDSFMGSLTAVLLDEPPHLKRAGRPLDRLISELLHKDPADRPVLTEALAILDSPMVDRERQVDNSQQQAAVHWHNEASTVRAGRHRVDVAAARPSRVPLDVLADQQEAARRKSRRRKTVQVLVGGLLLAAGLGVPVAVRMWH
ncbi:serine/threonine protein kinase [Kitasatospora xanthocidica]|uniref:non-specific serine/threonine protein kinase n=1 Tax=Kitasatospora xanthocidica TaxID=83382 RepID=A0A372ZTW8_9ACTN|nr:serine/threonine-protein kinase [Kitasatospora xanthocidica]RGD59368.1 serine/threonine protein kinase [Kitasatospora xanthocidica]